MTPDRISPSKRIAGIDIGTNTLLMLIADVYADGTVCVIRDEHSIARLGQGVHESGRISEAALSRAREILARYRGALNDLDVEIVRAVATSAMRDATNALIIKPALEYSLGSGIDIIDGQEEARLTFVGSGGTGFFAVLDIGGGSTELAIGQGDTIDWRASLDVGAVRLTELFFNRLPVPPNKVEEASAFVQGHLSTIDVKHIPQLIAVAGTPTTLAAISMGLKEFDATRVHRSRLRYEFVNSSAEFLFESPLEAIVDLPGVNPKRADILPAGTLILREVMRFFGLSDVIVSAQGLRYGLVLDAARR